ncbi:MAG: novP [Solirubrobacterales bacterium]|nr:novP [Solirubrobacterales bacterium]
MDVRWRMWVLTSAAKQAQALDGAFAEFGSYRGGCAYMMLASTSGTPMWLYDTFDGIPSVGLDEREQSMARRYADTSVQAVRDLLAEWDERITLVAGDVFNTLPTNDPGPLAMSHLDLNAAAPTVHALGFAYERTVPGGVLLFDDYGWGGYEAQREVVDRFFAERPEAIIALPTGQALVTKLR